MVVGVIHLIIIQKDTNIVRTLHEFVQKPRRLLLLDFMGAIATSLATMFLLASFLLASERLPTGLPTWLLYLMALVAAGLACFDIAAITLSLDVAIALGIIAVLNLSYCIAVLIVLWVYRRDVTELGFVYFCIEIAIVLPLAAWEWTISRRLIASP